MQEESLSTISSDERPTPEELEDYTRQFPLDPDLTPYRNKLPDWLHDYRKRKEQEHSDGSKTPLVGHSYESRGARDGFDPMTFDITKIAKDTRRGQAH